MASGKDVKEISDGVIQVGGTSPRKMHAPQFDKAVFVVAIAEQKQIEDGVMTRIEFSFNHDFLSFDPHHKPMLLNCLKNAIDTLEKEY